MAVAELREKTATTPAHAPATPRRPRWTLPRRLSPVVLAGAAIGVLGAGTGISYAVGVPSRRRCAPSPAPWGWPNRRHPHHPHRRPAGGDIALAHRGGDRGPPSRVDPSSGPHPEQPTSRRHFARQRGAGPSAGPSGGTCHGRDDGGRAASVERSLPATRRVRTGHCGLVNHRLVNHRLVHLRHRNRREHLPGLRARRDLALPVRIGDHEPLVQHPLPHDPHD